MTFCQRWRARRDRYVPAATCIDPRDFAVDVIPQRQARPFVEQHHYSGTFPAARLSCGLFRAQAGVIELAGVAVFSVPMNNRAIPLHTGQTESAHGAELGRFVLLDDVAGNGETWFLSRALRALRAEKPAIEAVLSYADPIERRAADGAIVKPGHIGTIYQAMSAQYRGLSGNRTEYLAGGMPISGRALSKIRLGEQGVDYSIAQLVAAGADRREYGEEPAQWLTRIERDGFVQRRRRPGNHVYAFPLTRRARRAAAHLPVAAYPKGERCGV